MRYDRQTRTLMKEIQALDASMDENILGKLARLEKTATALQDDYLLGFTYYYYAFSKYNFGKDRSDFTRDLSLAVHYLMRSGDHDFLSRVFTLVAIDAFSYGSYDVAYNYYMHALREAVHNQNAVSVAILETNISLIFLELRDYKQAKTYIRKAVRRLYAIRDHAPALFSLHAAYVDEAAISLCLEDLPSAKKALSNACRFLPKNPAPDEDLSLSLTMVKLRLAYALGDNDEGDALANDLVGLLEKEPVPESYAGDIRSLCEWLLEKGRVKLVGRVIDAVNDRILSSGMAHVLHGFTMLKVEYCRALKDNALLNDALSEQQALLKEQRANINRIHKYTLDLVRIDNNIRNEQIHTMAENEHLQQKAYRDALTGLANRHMLNKLLEASFERAYNNKTMLGIEILDIDYFKEYNDTFGHPEGDKCLVMVASEIDALSSGPVKKGASIYTGRYGGDEFVVIYEGLDEEDILSRARALAGRIDRLSIKHPASKISSSLTISQGICVSLPARKQKVWDLLSEADSALYEVKESRSSGRKVKDGIAMRKSTSFDERTRKNYGRL